jgi:hypothetical protein
MRGWNPSRFYPIDTSFRKEISRYDRALLEDPYRLDQFLHRRQWVWVRHSDTLFMPYDRKD